MTRKTVTAATVETWRTVLATITASLIGYFVIMSLDDTHERELSERVASVEATLKMQSRQLDRIEREIQD